MRVLPGTAQPGHGTGKGFLGHAELVYYTNVYITERGLPAVSHKHAPLHDSPLPDIAVPGGSLRQFCKFHSSFLTLHIACPPLVQRATPQWELIALLLYIMPL